MPLVAKAPKRETAPKDGYDPSRLRRAAQLACKKLGPRQYRVKGQDEPHYDVALDVDPPCYCKDAEFHGRGCKHELCARLHDGDGALIQALGDILIAQAERNAELEKSSKRRKRA